MLEAHREPPGWDANPGIGAEYQASGIASSHATAGAGKLPAARKKGAGLGRIIAFFLFLGLLAVLLNAVINFGLRRIKTSKFGTLNREFSGEVNADVIINGSSRALDHYDPRIIEQVTGHSGYNIGMNASQTDFQLAILKAYLSHNRSPQVVLQNLDSFTFEGTAAGDIYDPGYLIPYLRDANLYEGLHDIDPVVWKWRYIPLYGYSVEDMRFTWLTGLLGAAGVNPREDYFDGFNPQYREWTADFDQFKKEHTNGVPRRIEPKMVADLEEIAKVCHERGIQLIFVYSPELAEAQHLVTNRDEIFAKFREIATRYQVPVWDYSGSPMCKNQSYFYNSQHLNAEGAEVFSNDLAVRLRDSHLLSP